MYEVDEKDAVWSLETIPQSSVGAPIPLVLSDEGTTVVAYYAQETPKGWDGRTIRMISPTEEDEPVILVRFHICYAAMFGPPNDEAFEGHPLASRGLKPYGSFVVENSSWLRKLERMNAVHSRHQPERYWQLKHYILSFHDSTFECIADGYSVEERRGSVQGSLPRMVELLN